MNTMKRGFKASYLLAFIVFLPIVPINTTFVLARDSVYQLAQSNSNFKQLMQQGYAATKRRNYRQALQFFQQAKQLRNGDRFANSAINNVTGYIQRGRRSVIGFVPGKPGRVAAAATRGVCFQDAQLPIPLTPSDKEAQTTTAEYPTFYFYIPEAKAKVQAIEFVLRDDENIQPLYRETFKPVTQAGIVSISLPTNKPSLKTGKEYTWGFSVICDIRSRDEDLYTEGKIERSLDENLAVQLREATNPLDRAILYATAGFWEDALTIVVNLRRQRPNDREIEQYYQDLLKSVGIKEEVINKPFLPCCDATRNQQLFKSPP